MLSTLLVVICASKPIGSASVNSGVKKKTNLPGSSWSYERKGVSDLILINDLLVCRLVKDNTGRKGGGANARLSWLNKAYFFDA